MAERADYVVLVSWSPRKLETYRGPSLDEATRVFERTERHYRYDHAVAGVVELAMGDGSYVVREAFLGTQ